MSEEFKKQDAEQSTDEETKPQIFDAIRHVGPTLEAEGKYDDVLGTALSSSESQLQDADGGDPLTIRTIEEKRRELTEQASAPQPLKTRLPGDSSSDPHTDLGPDNATTAHAYTEEEQETRPSRKAS